MSFVYFVLAALFLLPISCEPTITDTIAMSFSINGKKAGEIEIGLFGEVVPKTVQNFKALCKGDQKSPNDPNQLLSYKKSKIHRIVPGFIIQGGDFTKGDGKGGESIYGGKFEDENFEIKHFEGCVSMANAGPNTNGSQFFFTIGEAPWLDGIHVVFGKVLKNKELLNKLEAYGSQYGTTSAQILIEGCREIVQKRKKKKFDDEL